MRALFPLGVVLLILLALPGVFVFGCDLFGYGAEINTSLEGWLGVSHRVAISLPAAAVLFAIPLLILGLYFLRLRRKPVAVASTFLWKKSIEDVHVNRLIQWLRRNLILLLQLLASLTMIYGVLGPRLHGAISGGKHYIIMVDASASMAATDVAPTRLEWAKLEAIKEIDACTDHDFGMVIAFSDVAEIRQSYTNNRTALRKAVENIKQTVRSTRIDEALGLASGLANPARSTENESVAPSDPIPGKERSYVGAEGFQADIHLYSDGKFPAAPELALTHLDLTYHVPPVVSKTVGSSDNVAILRMDAERDPADPSTVLVHATVKNFRDRESVIRPRLELLDNADQLISAYDDDDFRRDGKRTAIPARSEHPGIVFTLRDVPENVDRVLRMKLEGADDAFPLDDVAWAVLGVVRKAKILIVGPKNPRLRDFFDSPATAKIAEVSYLPPEVLTGTDPKPYAIPAKEGIYDLILFDRCAPATVADLPTSNTLFIGTPPPPYRMATPTETGPTFCEPAQNPEVRGWTSRHPVMRNLQALDEIEVIEAFRFREIPPRTTRLIEGSENLVLLAALARGPYTDLALAFPLLTSDGRWNTNWPLKLSFPLFLRNCVIALGNVRDASTEDTLHPGQAKRLRMGSVPEIVVNKPDGSEVRLERGNRTEFSFSETDRLGIYTARGEIPTTKERVQRRFSVNHFDLDESDIAPVEKVVIGNTTIQAGAPRKQPRDLWKWPLVIGLFVLLVEWHLYNRRVRL